MSFFNTQTELIMLGENSIIKSLNKYKITTKTKKDLYFPERREGGGGKYYYAENLFISIYNPFPSPQNNIYLHQTKYKFKNHR